VRFVVVGSAKERRKVQRDDAAMLSGMQKNEDG
jgi:hypothetical protein